MFTESDYEKLHQIMAESPEKEELLTRLLHSHRMDISTISHEIRNPLTLIYSTLQMIEASNPEVLNIRHWSDLHSDIEYMKDDNCIFCKLANGEIPTATLYEDEDFRVILDASPASKGHALIIPKEHYANLYELDDDKAAKVMVLAKKMITKLTGILHCDGYNIVQNNNEAAGQTVFHFHLHMIPRYKGDEVGLGWKMGELTEEDKQDILSKL